jgi:hypothetical protein
MLLPLIALSGCNKEDAERAQAKPVQQVAAPAQAPTPPPPEASEVKISNDLAEFSYAYPAAAAAIPELKALLDEDRDGRRGSLFHDAREARLEAKANDYPFRPYALGYDWQVVTELPGWLSLSAGVFSDTGGAHPNHWPEALLWDKNAKQRRAAADLFVSPQALAGAIRDPFCAELDKQRAERRGARVDPSSGDEFDQCIDPLKEAVILGSSNGKTFDRIGILVGPYSAGPYAEGDYEVTVPVTGAVMRALKPHYRASFAIGR